MCAFSGKDNGEASKNAGRESGDFSDIATRFMRSCVKLADRGVFISRRQNFDLSKISSIGIGGTVAAAFFPDTLAGLTELINQLKQSAL
ncbi:MAG: hypothetical protein ACI4RO_05795, partial [Candidatus Scatosoma sp.]